MSEIRIVSLLSSATETIFRLGLEKYLVARSHECDYPPQVLELPAVTTPKFPTDGTSYEIDERLRAIVSEGLSVYRVDAQKLFDLKPTHILTQIQCQVCAVNKSDVEEAVRLCDIDAQIISFEAEDFEGVLLDIRKLARALNADLSGEKLIREMKNRLINLQKATSSFKSKRIFIVEWLDPLISSGHWIPELVEMAGGEILLAAKGKLSPVLRWDEVIKADPDVVLVAPCGFGISKTKEEIKISLKKAPWEKLRAYQNGEVFISDGNQFFNRAGPRLVETAEIVAEALHYREGVDFEFSKSGLLTKL